MELTEQEKSIVVEIVSKTQVSPLQNNATEIMAILQSIIKKLSPVEKTEK